MAIALEQPFVVGDFTTGLIDDLSVGGNLFPKNAVGKAINVLFNRPRGSVTQRLGTTQLGDTIGQTINGLHNHRSSSASNHQLLAAANGSIYRLNGSSFASMISGLSSSAKVRFLTYLDNVVFFNGIDQPQSSTTPGVWVSTGGNLDVGSWPRDKFASTINTRAASWGRSTDPDTLHLSSLASSSGAISWSSGNKDIQVYPNDGGGNSTGITGNGRVILLFKERGLYRYDDSELQRIGFVGTTSHESIVTDDNGITYFFGQGSNGVGFYMTNGGRPVKISRAIIKYVEAISSSFYENIAAFTDGSKIEWSIGSITIDGITYTNAYLVYFISEQSWSVYNRADRFRVFSQYINSDSAITTVGGDTDGMVQTLDSGNTDNGSAISSECEFSSLVFTTRGRTKTVSEICTYAEHYQGMELMMKMDKKTYQKIGSINKRNRYFKGFPILRGNELFVKIIATNTGEPFQLDGFEFPVSGVLDEGYFESV